MEAVFDRLVSWVTDPVVLQVFVVVLLTVVFNYLAIKLFDQIEIKTLQSHTLWDDALINSMRGPLALLIWVFGISWAAEIVLDGALEKLIEPARYVAVVGLFTLFLTRFVRECEAGFVQIGADITTSTAIGKLLRIAIFITAALTILQTLGVSISGILAFGGVGGIAVGFAAKDLLANFFGGVMIHLDRPFSIGDWIRSPDREIEGTVESIGWRLTVIRTFDKRPLYVPNSVFANIAVENPSRMQNRRIYETIGVRYADADKIKQIVDDVRAMLENHEDIDTERTLIVNFNAFAASSLDFFIYTYTKTTDWVAFHGVKEKILLAVYQIIESAGAEIAFPTSTIELTQAGPEPE